MKKQDVRVGVDVVDVASSVHVAAAVGIHEPIRVDGAFEKKRRRGRGCGTTGRGKDGHAWAGHAWVRVQWPCQITPTSGLL